MAKSQKRDFYENCENRPQKQFVICLNTIFSYFFLQLTILHNR
uniref:Uncharacterized protein n=1 Tax=Lepeophtheirus salmonis TaxID=72036 RepID=A0A0K2TXJ1_LEPSM